MSYGPEAVHELVEESGWSYPVTVRRLRSEHSLANIEIDRKGRSTTLVELLERADDVDGFESKADLERKLEPTFERIRKDRRPGLVGRLRRRLSL